MKKFLVPAALALSLASVAAQASAIEGTLDGVVYSLPEETGFFAVGTLGVDAAKLQETVDELRRVIPADQPMYEFMSTPLTAAAADRGLNVVLMREPATPSEGRLAIQRARDAATFEDGVAKLDVSKLKDAAPGMRAYAVQTGLGFAPEATGTCAMDSYDKRERCTFSIPRPNGHRLAWPGARLTEFDPKVMRLEIVDLIERTLPVEAERQRKGEPIQPPAQSTVTSVPTLEATLDGIVYAAPAGSVFRGKDGTMLKAAEVQAVIDAKRKDVAPEKPLPLFGTRPVSSDASKAGVVLDVSRLSDPVHEDTEFPEVKCEGIKPHADVACLDMTAIKDDESYPGLRGYGIKTGLPFAKEAYVRCVDEFDGRECEVQTRRDRILLEWTKVSLDDKDASAVRDRVRKLISDALPQEAAKAK